jgi:addiction module HigA family antidote
MKMHRPPHPGEVLRELCLKPLGLTVTEAARALGVSRKTLSGILNERAGISPEMAVRLSLAFDTTAESWLNQQVQYDLWHAERNRKRRALRVCLLPEDRRCGGRGWWFAAGGSPTAPGSAERGTRCNRSRTTSRARSSRSRRPSCG